MMKYAAMVETPHPDILPSRSSALAETSHPDVLPSKPSVPQTDLIKKIITSAQHWSGEYVAAEARNDEAAMRFAVEKLLSLGGWTQVEKSLQERMRRHMPGSAQKPPDMNAWDSFCEARSNSDIACMRRLVEHLFSTGGWQSLSSEQKADMFPYRPGANGAEIVISKSHTAKAVMTDVNDAVDHALGDAIREDTRPKLEQNGMDPENAQTMEPQSITNGNAVVAAPELPVKQERPSKPERVRMKPSVYLRSLMEREESITPRHIHRIENEISMFDCGKRSIKIAFTTISTMVLCKHVPPAALSITMSMITKFKLLGDNPAEYASLENTMLTTSEWY